MKILHRDGQEEECVSMCDLKDYPEYESHHRYLDKMKKVCKTADRFEMRLDKSYGGFEKMVWRSIRLNQMIDKYLLKDLPYSERITCVQVTRAGEKQYVEVKNKYLIK